ncbi:tRNA (guanosine(46)-N7)-methyltransferase TrmB [Parasynechococcus sp.]|uniref:tRNA (guanosine(46)-N7)-methyltransferase TrmB n=1 Tax=Parasynechococcus sp. TaxID=3101203 RepID=UPI003703B53E
MRQHVNPLSRFFQLPLQLPAPDALFQHPDQPIHLDIGCARGRCILGLADASPSWNHLGVEIRRPLVTAADREALSREHGNVRVLFCNANISLEGWMAALPQDRLQRVSIQFPDPWFKRRHRKRRVLQPALLLAIAAALEPGRELFLQSDVLAVIEPMVALTELSNCFERPLDDARPWRDNNPLSVPTERERYVLDQGLPVYRVLYRRNQMQLPDLDDLEHRWQEIDNPADSSPQPA